MSALILAIPSKGRLEEAAAEIFAKAGLQLKRDGARGYRGNLPGLDHVLVEYVSAGDIAARLAEGSVHMGITGEDLLREEIPDMESAVQLCLPLGFGQADVVVAIPDGWVDVTTMFDLADVAAEFRTRHGRLMRVRQNMSISPMISLSATGLSFSGCPVSAQPKRPPIRARPKRLSISPQPARL